MTCRSFAALFAVAVLGACQAASTAMPVSPREDAVDELTLHAEWVRGQIRIGETDTLAMTLTNHTAVDVTLDFRSGCQILPYVEDAAGQLSHPDGGAWGCTAALTSLTVPARQSVRQLFTVRGGTPIQGIHANAPLPPGAYMGYARLAESNLRSNSAPLLVVP